MIVRQIKRTVHQSFEIDLLTNHLIRRCRLALLDEVPTAKFIRRQAHCLRHLVEVAFQRKDALRRTKSAKCAMRGNIRRDRATVNTNVRTEIRPGGMDRSARKYDRR